MYLTCHSTEARLHPIDLYSHRRELYFTSKSPTQGLGNVFNGPPRRGGVDIDGIVSGIINMQATRPEEFQGHTDLNKNQQSERQFPPQTVCQQGTQP